MSRLRSRPLAVLIAGVLAAGCGGGGNSGPPPGDVITVSKTMASGDAQTGRVGQPLASPIQVLVTENGSAASGITVTWSTTAAGGTMSPPSGPTNADGVASSAWSLGTVSGAQTSSATVTGATGSPVTFTATAAAGPAATIAKVPGGDGQTADIGTQLALPVQAEVADEHGNAVAGTTVGWAATGATVSSPAVPSDLAGLSSVTVTAGGTAGPIIITATADGLGGSPLTFNATAVAPPPPPTSIAITVGNDFFRSNRNQTTSPAVDTVAVGGTVTWTWAATAASHNVTSNPPPGFTGSSTQAPPADHQFTFTTAGTYRYYCSIHATASSTSGMIGRIVVQ